jgi:SAM-dependent methyltransferase
VPDPQPSVLADLVGLMTCHAAVAALRLGVFDALTGGPSTVTELAARTGTHPEALDVLLAPLAEVGYLERAGDTYANSPVTARDLAGGHWATVLPLWVAMVDAQWGDLEAAVRTGVPPAGFYPWLDGATVEREQFHTLQRGLAAGLAAEVVETVEVPTGARALLDVGGGEGAFALAFCAAHPALTATVLDRASVLDAGRERIAGAGLTDRVAMRGADLEAELRERDQDVVLLCNVVHGFAPDRARALLAECARALRPGGVLVVVESMDRRDDDAPVADRAFTRFFDLHLHHTQGGRIHPAPVLAGWLTEAGCRVRHHAPLPRHPGHTLLVAQRPAPG